MRRRNIRSLLAIIGALLLVTTACSGGEDSGTSSSDFGAGSDAEASTDTTASRNYPSDSDSGSDSLSEEEAEAVYDEDAEDAFAAAPTATAPTAAAAVAAAQARSTSATIPDALEYAAKVDADEQFGRSEQEASGGLFDEPTTIPPRDPYRNNQFADNGVRPFVETVVDPLSTFALDVDTGSYTVARRFLNEGSLPDPDSVRPEEYVNAFAYDYGRTNDDLAVTVEGGPSPFDDRNVLVRIGVQSRTVDSDLRPQASLTFVIDTSGSMDREDRLPLVKAALSKLVHELEPTDTIAVVTYDSNAGMVLEPTPVSNITTILESIGRLQTGGSTNLEAGLRRGYALAYESFIDDGINRVILASDGVANVGSSNAQTLVRMIEDDAAAGIELVTVGFGMGSYNDELMEQLANRGDGFYAYVDTYAEAEVIFEENLTATLLTVAKDAKIQVEWDDDNVTAYRLIGFENRGVRDSDFRNDAVDAGEIGAGHQVTAIYELRLDRNAGRNADLGRVNLRWLRPNDGEPVEISESIDRSDIRSDWTTTSDSFQLATTAAVWAETLRQSPYSGDVSLDKVANEAERLAIRFDNPRTQQFADLTRQAVDLSR